MRRRFAAKLRRIRAPWLSPVVVVLGYYLSPLSKTTSQSWTLMIRSAMANEARMIGYELLKTGTLVSFRIVEEEVLSAPERGRGRPAAATEICPG